MGKSKPCSLLVWSLRHCSRILAVRRLVVWLGLARLVFRLRVHLLVLRVDSVHYGQGCRRCCWHRPQVALICGQPFRSGAFSHFRPRGSEKRWDASGAFEQMIYPVFLAVLLLFVCFGLCCWDWFL